MRSERWSEEPEDEGSTPSWPTNIKDSDSKNSFCRFESCILPKENWRNG